MANLRVRPAEPAEHIVPKALTQFDPYALSHVTRDMGDSAEAAATAATRIGDQLGRYADEAATLEGKRAGESAGLDPSYRPVGETTLRGRSFEEAATKTYLEKLNAATHADAMQLYQANKNDPAKLGAALDGMHADYLDQHLFPEIEGRWSAHFTQLRTAYVNQATNNAETNAKDADKAGLITNLNTIDTTTKQAIATLDPNVPGVEEIVRGGISQKEDLYRQAAKSGAITQSVAETAILKSRREDLKGLIYSRAEKAVDAAGVQTFIDKTVKDFAAGKLKGLDGEGYDSLMSDLATLQKRRLTEDRTVANGLSKSLDGYVDRYASGQTPPPAEWQALLTTAKSATNGDALVTLAQAKISLADKLKSLPPEDGDSLMIALRQKWRDEGGVDVGRGTLLDYGDKYVADYRRGLNTDQLGTAQARGVVASVTPLDFAALGANPSGASIEAFGGQVAARVAQAHAVGATLARTPQYLRPEEKQRLRDMVQQGGAPAMALTAAIVKGAGEDAPSVLHEIGGTAPLLAQAGAIIAGGGSIEAARDAYNFQARKASGGAVPPDIDAITRTATVKSVLGTVYQLRPGDQGRVINTADAIARERIAHDGIDIKTDTSSVKAIYERAMREATGAVFVGDTQYGGPATYKPAAWWFGGSQQVLVPAGVRADKFSDAIGAITDADLATLKAPPGLHAADLRAAVPIKTRQGYVFANKSFVSSETQTWVNGANGRPWELDWNAIEPALRRRVPDAFMGASP